MGTGTGTGLGGGLLDRKTRCPTCGASQDWSDTCRRCKCDLGPLLELARAHDAARRAALADLRANRPAAALVHARRALRLVPGPDAARIAAVAALLAGRWAEALKFARLAERE